MKTIDYEQFLAEHRSKGFVSDDANRIANTLICENCIRTGNELARLLDVNCYLDNHKAIRVWVHRRLDAKDSYVVDELCRQLQSELYEMFSTVSYGL